MKKTRGSGILLHITSLPSAYGIGDCGPAAYEFVDFLTRAGQSFWQILPLTPIDPIYGNSPYSSNSAFAGNIFLLSPQLLIEDGLLTKSEGKSAVFAPGECDYERAMSFKQKLLHRAFSNFKQRKTKDHQFEEFCLRHAQWLDDYALFAVVKKQLFTPAWCDWPKELALRHAPALRKVKREHQDDIRREKFFQYLFFKQWFALKKYCNERGIKIIGDVPIYVSYDSACVWAHSEFFKLRPDKRPQVVAGVPPDYFSATGQLWGNPVYAWDRLRQDGYQWWLERFAHNLSLFDLVRIDHFRGLVACWEVPAGETTAVNGKWTPAPVDDFFRVLSRRFFTLPIIAEDLGVITAEVREVLRNYSIAGMKVLFFAFGEDNPMHPYLPHTYEHNSVVYTGTHDTNTVCGWFEREAKEEDRRRLARYLGQEPTRQTVHWQLIRLMLQSVAEIAIIPMQDVLGLGEEARMNRPSVVHGNWKWRLQQEDLRVQAIAERLAEMTRLYGRV